MDNVKSDQERERESTRKERALTKMRKAEIIAFFYCLTPNKEGATLFFSSTLLFKLHLATLSAKKKGDLLFRVYTRRAKSTVKTTREEKKTEGDREKITSPRQPTHTP